MSEMELSGSFMNEMKLIRNKFAEDYAAETALIAIGSAIGRATDKGMAFEQIDRIDEIVAASASEIESTGEIERRRKNLENQGRLAIIPVSLLPATLEDMIKLAIRKGLATETSERYYNGRTEHGVFYSLTVLGWKWYSGREMV